MPNTDWTDDVLAQIVATLDGRDYSAWSPPDGWNVWSRYAANGEWF